jgi:hypothetical protein
MIEKSNNIGYDFMQNVYYIWGKGVRTSVKLNKHYSENNGWIRGVVWESARNYSQFKMILDCLHISIKMKGKWNGQTKTEFEKNSKRVKDIVAKSAGDKDKAVALSTTQANRITDEWKAINRAMAAKKANEEHIFEVFFQRAFELGSVTKQDYRNYKLEKLGI